MSAEPRPSAPTLAYLSTPGSISLAPPFPTAHTSRNVNVENRSSSRPVRNASPISGSSSSKSAILLGAAAVTAAKTFVLDAQHEHRALGRNSLSGWTESVDNGGVALLVMALCAGRIVVELRSTLRHRRIRGKGRVVEGQPSRVQVRQRYRLVRFGMSV